MALEPHYGETLLSDEESEALTPEVRELLGDPIRKADLYDLEQLAWQWEHQEGLDARTLGIATHAALVRIHPFVDGNGRVTRLLADLVYLAGQSGAEPIHAYDWEIDRPTDIRLLGEYDVTRNPRALAAFIPVINLEEQG